jgi:hypothetical protein
MVLILVGIALATSVVGAGATGFLKRVEILERLIAEGPEAAIFGLETALGAPELPDPPDPPAAETYGPPDGVPVGPPDWVPVGPPDWLMDGPPYEPPVALPDRPPVKPPVGPPAAR